MTRGRKPLPRETLALRDTLRRDRERPSSTIGEPVPVEKVHELCQVSGLQGATERARKIYWATCRKVAAQGMLDVAFCQQLLIYAIELDLLIKCEESVKRDGTFLTGVNKEGATYTYPNPAVKMMQGCVDKLLKIGGNFGFDPVSRSRLKVFMQDDGKKVTGVKAVFAAVFADADQEDADEQ